MATVLDVTAVPVDASYYATVAQVIPTLLLAAAVEHRLLLPRQPVDEAELSTPFTYRLSLALFTIAAFVGELAAVQALYAGVGRPGRTLTLLGVIAALYLVFLPLCLRALGGVFEGQPRLRYYVFNHVLPALLLLSVVVILIGDLMRD